jgi:glycosyltransferase involved in cell wall biosynthesis
MNTHHKPAVLAVVIPCYNEEEVLPETVKQLTVLMQEMERDGLTDAGSAVWFVDDGSKDKTWALIEGYVVSNPYIRGLIIAATKTHYWLG